MVLAGAAVAVIGHHACTGTVAVHSSMCGTAGSGPFNGLVALGAPMLVAAAWLNAAARRSIHLLALTVLTLDAVLACWIASAV
jgi:hypothetical protein